MINSTDKILRVYSINPSVSEFKWESTNEIIDSINRLQWKCVCFSKDAEYIFAGTAERAEHNIYYWTREYRDMAGVLEGPKDSLLHICVSKIFFVSKSHYIYFILLVAS